VLELMGRIMNKWLAHGNDGGITRHSLR
jgi:hypothetical protein